MPEAITVFDSLSGVRFLKGIEKSRFLERIPQAATKIRRAVHRSDFPQSKKEEPEASFDPRSFLSRARHVINRCESSRTCLSPAKSPKRLPISSLIGNDEKKKEKKKKNREERPCPFLGRDKSLSNFTGETTCY